MTWTTYDPNCKYGNCAQCGYTDKCKMYTHPHSGRWLKMGGVITRRTPFMFVWQNVRAVEVMWVNVTHLHTLTLVNIVAAPGVEASTTQWQLIWNEQAAASRPSLMLALKKWTSLLEVAAMDVCYYSVKAPRIFALNTLTVNGLDGESNIKPFL